MIRTRARASLSLISGALSSLFSVCPGEEIVCVDNWVLWSWTAVSPPGDPVRLGAVRNRQWEGLDYADEKIRIRQQ